MTGFCNHRSTKGLWRVKTSIGAQNREKNESAIWADDKDDAMTTDATAVETGVYSDVELILRPMTWDDER